MADTEHSQTSSFASQHLSMIFKYIGISFVAGAVSHGVFSGSRSLFTAGLGVIMFLIGQWIEYRQTGNGGKTMWQSLLVGAVLAIGMGFFTGSLQHFPDSPQRSLWVVPIGFTMTLATLLWLNKDKLTGNVKRYAAISMVTVSAISLGSYQYFSLNPMADNHGGHDHGTVASTATPDAAAHDHAAHDHSTETVTAPSTPVMANNTMTNAVNSPVSTTVEPAHDHSTHDHGTTAVTVQSTPAHDHSTHDHSSQTVAIGQAGEAAKVDRVINITMDDTMRYQPSNISVKENETVRFVVENKGKIKHELTLGDPAALKEHAEKMLKFPNMQHNDPNMVALEAGKTGEIIWQFTKAGTVDFACLQPGHFEAGMRGAVVVKKPS